MLMNDFCDPSSRRMLVDTDWFPAHTDDTAVFSKSQFVVELKMMMMNEFRC
jgi:hypothetical protein